MSEPECDLSELPVSQCACRVHKPAEPAPKYEIAFRFTARYDSTLDCGHRCREGDSIAKTTDIEYVCGECAS